MSARSSQVTTCSGGKYLAGLVPGAVGVIDELISAGPSAFVS